MAGEAAFLLGMHEEGDLFYVIPRRTALRLAGRPFGLSARLSRCLVEPELTAISTVKHCLGTSGN